MAGTTTAERRRPRDGCTQKYCGFCVLVEIEKNECVELQHLINYVDRRSQSVRDNARFSIPDTPTMPSTGNYAILERAEIYLLWSSPPC